MDNNSIFVGNLPVNWENQDLRKEFSNFGPITRAVVAKDFSGETRRYGFVTFSRPEDAAKAINNSKGILDGTLKVAYAKTEPFSKRSPQNLQTVKAGVL